MALPATSLLPTTPEAYLDWEEAQQERHEFYRGEVFAMAGGSFRHSQLTANVTRRLGNALDGSGCQVLSSDMRVLVRANGLYTYPDLSAICGEPEFETDRETTLTNPVLIIEVLSDSTESYDRGAKFRLYREIPSLVEYVLISQKERAVDVFRRDARGWLVVEPDADSVELVSVGATLSLDDLYEGVTVDAAEHPTPGEASGERA